MKPKKIVASASAGVLVMGVGGVLMGIGAVEFVLSMFPALPLWATYFIFGTLVAVTGTLVVLGSAAEAEEQIEERFTVDEQVGRHPWATVGASVATGFVLSALVAVLRSGTSRRKETPSSNGNTRTPGSRSESRPPTASKPKPSLWDDIAGAASDFGKSSGEMVLTLGTRLAGQVIADQFNTKPEPPPENRSNGSHNGGHRKPAKRTS